MTASAPAIDFISLMGPVARLLLGEPNAKLSSDRELRFGTHGSLCVDLEKGVWKSFEDDQGGGVLDLIEREKGLTGVAAFRWLEENHLKEPNSNVHHQLSIIIETYPYVDAGGHCRYEVVRFDPKDFRQRRRDANGDWIWNLHGVQPLPYHLPELIEAIAQDRIVFIVEGERDVHSLATFGIAATCNSGGAGNWHEELNIYFRDADVIVIADNDPQATDKNGKPLFHKDGRPKRPGQDHANHVCKTLQPIARRVRYLDLKAAWAACPPKGDITNWIEAGGSVEQLWATVEELPSYILIESTKAPDAPGGKLIQSSAEFVAGFVPPDYTVDGLLQEGFLYSLTGATGAGKTAIDLRLAASVARGVLFANRETKKKRVLYLAGENADDVRMRWIALAQHMDFDVDAIEVFFIEGVFKISQMAATLKQEAERVGGDFGLIIIDTGPAFFEGDDENSRTQQGKHAEMLRGLIILIPGKPTVIANCHPVKNATADNLLPAGGGNFLNQVDGNLTAAKTDSTTELHFQGKFRGVEFAPMHFMLKTVTHERLKDKKGRLIPTVICDWISDSAKEEITAQKVRDEDQLLALIADDPKASQSSLAIKMGWKLYSGEPHKTKVKRCIANLKREKLIKETRRGFYKLTAEGKKVLAPEQT